MYSLTSPFTLADGILSTPDRRKKTARRASKARQTNLPKTITKYLLLVHRDAIYDTVEPVNL